MGDFNESTINILSSLLMMLKTKSDVMNKNIKKAEKIKDTIFSDRYGNLPVITTYAIKTMTANERVVNGLRN